MCICFGKLKFCRNDEGTIRISTLESKAEDHTYSLNSIRDNADSERESINDVEQHDRANTIRMFWCSRKAPRNCKRKC